MWVSFISVQHECVSMPTPELLPREVANGSEHFIRRRSRRHALRSVVKRALTQAPQVRQPIICNKQGKAYTVDGFNTIFYRAMRKAVQDEKTGLAERFQFRDLRAKSASDDTAEAASKRLGHADVKITERVYRRKAERAKPLR